SSCVFLMEATKIDMAPDAEARFAVWQTHASGRCIARVWQRQAGTTLEFDFPHPDGVPDPLIVQPSAIAALPASWFVGRDVVERRSDERAAHLWRVQRVFRNPTW